MSIRKWIIKKLCKPNEAILWDARIGVAMIMTESTETHFLSQSDNYKNFHLARADNFMRSEIGRQQISYTLVYP